MPTEIVSMHTFRLLLTLFVSMSLTSLSFAQKKEQDDIAEVQRLISQAYELGHVDVAPLEMSRVEEKVIEARTAKEKRKKKTLAKLLEQIKADLAIIAKRYEVNQLHQQLTDLQKQNTQSTKMLDELKGQLQ